MYKREVHPFSKLPIMVGGNQPSDGGHLSLTWAERNGLIGRNPESERFVRRFVGSHEFINSVQRFCLWIADDDASLAVECRDIADRISAVGKLRSSSRSKQSIDASKWPHRFVYAPHRGGLSVIVPKVSSERRLYLPCGVFDEQTVVSDLARVIYEAPLWSLAIISSRIHLQWIATVCGKLETRYRYSNTLGWNTFPIPPLTEKNKADLTRCAEDILLAREAHFPATIADLYDPDDMPDNLRAAHGQNDETLERIYIGRQFRNDTERLEKLFDLYTKMTADKTPKKSAEKGRA